jgi:hypothetical protein
MMRKKLIACLVAPIVLGSLPAMVQTTPFSLSYLGQQIVPSGTNFSGTIVGGLSSIDYVTSTNRYLAISDDRSATGPARFYDIRLDLTQFQRSATPGSAGVGFSSSTVIQTPGGTPFALNTVDPEGMRFNPLTSSLYWANEGQRAAGANQNPTVREMTIGGAPVRDFSVPTRYNPGAGASDPGIRNNLAFESLAISTNGQILYTATENALVQDGPASSTTTGSPARILSFDIASGASGAEYVYQVSPVVLPPISSGLFATNGLTDFIAVGDRQFITIERSFAIGAATPGAGPFGATGNTIRLYYADARNATDVSGIEALAGQSYTAVQKTLLLDLSDLRNDDGSALALDNIEGITFGPEVNGRQTLVLVSDNNFSGTQFTQFVALQVTPVPEPATLGMLLAGSSIVGLVVRRRRR